MGMRVGVEVVAMLEPLDERAAGQRAARRRGAERRWGVIVALVVFIGVMVALSKWAGRPEEGTTTPTTTTTGATTQNVGPR
jgi:hypothetical protein